MILNIEDDDMKLRMIAKKQKEMIEERDFVDERIIKHKKAFHESEVVVNKLAIRMLESINMEKDLQAEWVKQDFHLDKLHELTYICDSFKGRVMENEKKIQCLG